VTQKIDDETHRAGNPRSRSKFRTGKPERRGPTPGSVKIPFNYGADHSDATQGVWATEG